MRLKIRKLLKGGSYSVSFETLGFNSAEAAQIRRCGMPVIDLTDVGLGTRRLDRMNFVVQCASAHEAELTILRIQERARQRISDFLAQPVSSYLGQSGRARRWRTVSMLGMALAVIFLLFTAYQGVISSQQTTEEKIPTSTAASSQAVGESSTAVVRATSSDSSQSQVQTSPVVPALAFKGGASQTSGYSMTTEPHMPGFTLSVTPEVLTPYSTWGTQEAKATKQPISQSFKLALIPSGGLQGPITLAVLDAPSSVQARLYPSTVNDLPGSSTLSISVPANTPPQSYPEITVLARAQGPDGQLITRRKKIKLTILQSSSYSGPVWNVSTQGSDQSGDGSAGSPFRSIQRAVDCARSGDTVLVEPGMYLENLELMDKEEMLLASLYIFDQDTSTANSTIIQALNPGWVITVGRSNDVTVCGFTIQKGKGQDGVLGGGIYCYDSHVDILNNVIKDNRNHSGYGAGIYCYQSQPNIVGNRIFGNSNPEGHGAGIYCYRSDPEITGNVISGNSADGGGSAIHLLNPTFAAITRNLIHHELGAACVVLYNKGKAGDFRMVNNTISQNQGDGVRIFGGPWNLDNNIIVGNHGYGVYALDGTVYFSHNDVWANVSGDDTTDFCGLEKNPSEVNGNVSSDPLFGDPIHGNFLLCLGSPCINSGDPRNAAPVAGAGRVDMGAFEYAFPAMMCGDVNRDGTIDYGDVLVLSNYLAGKTQIADLLTIADVNRDSKVNKADLTELYESVYFYAPTQCGPRESQNPLTKK
jgi:hypothetical protein